MNDEDHNSFEYWITDLGIVNLEESFAEEIARAGWLACRDHYHKDVAELVQAVLAIDVMVRVGPDASPVVDADRLERAMQFAAKLKEQQ